MLVDSRLDSRIEVIGCFPPYQRDPIEEYILKNKWYPFSDDMKGIIVRSQKELIELVKNFELGEDVAFINKIWSEKMGNPKEYTKIFPADTDFIYHESGELTHGRLFTKYWGKLKFNRDHFWDFRIGYKCPECKNILSGTPTLAVEDERYWLKGTCANKDCNTALFVQHLDYNTYHKRPIDFDD